MELSKVAKIVAMARFMTGIDKLTRERLHKDIKGHSKIGDIACYLKTYRDMPPVVDPYIMQVQTQPTQAVRSSRSMSRDRDSVTNRSKSISKPRGQNTGTTFSNVECFKCHKTGHISRECRAKIKCRNCQYTGHHERNCRNAPWCEYHQRTGHTTSDCRGRANKFRQNFQGGTGTQPQT